MTLSPRKAINPTGPTILKSCGQCINCRLKKSLHWGVRGQHEAYYHKECCFLTLTLSPNYLNSLDNPFTLDLDLMQRFFKRYRFSIYPTPIRYFHCGEYGDLNKRPHYHAIVFGHNFDDRKYFKTINGNKHYISEQLDSLWPYGFSTISGVTFKSMAYVARYATKKITGKAAEKHYPVINEATGEWWPRKPEYATMSRRPGLGAEWIKEFFSDVYPADRVVVRTDKKTFEISPPPYYDSFVDEEMLEKLKAGRAEKAKKHRPSEERLADLHKLSVHKFKRMVRELQDWHQ